MKSSVLKTDQYGSFLEAILCGYSLGILYPFLSFSECDISVDICVTGEDGFSNEKYCQVDPDGRSVHCFTKDCTGMSWLFFPTALLTYPTDGHDGCNLGGYSVHEHLYETGPSRVAGSQMLSIG